MNSDNKYTLQSVKNALSILDLFQTREVLGVTEVALLLETGRATAFRLLSTLEASGFLTKTSDAKYRLSFKLYTLGMLAYERQEYIQLIRPHLTKLTEATGETSHLVMWGDSRNVVFADKVLGSFTIRMDSMVGLKREAHYTATGKVLLAFSKSEFVNNYIKNTVFTCRTPFSITSEEKLRAVLDRIRINGYGTDEQESELGLFCLAAPLRKPSGEAFASISISGPNERMIHNQETYVTALKNTAYAIEREISL